MGKIKLIEDHLLRKWLESSIANGDGDNFAQDGLLYRGDIFFEDDAWHRKSGGEERLWEAADKKLLILTKDLNDTEAWNIREETGRRNELTFDYSKTSPFYKNIRMWSYGLLNTDSDGNTPPFSEAKDMNVSGVFYEKAPIARVNCKKQCGGGSISDKVLEEYIRRYASLLLQQISLYDANIIMCCGCKGDVNLILNFVRNMYLKDLACVEGTGDWIYYSPSTGKVVINTYHPSCRISFEDNYTNMMAAYQVFINSNKQ